MCLAYITVHYHFSPQQTDLFYKKEKKKEDLDLWWEKSTECVNLLLNYEIHFIVNYPQIFLYSVFKICFSSVIGNPSLENIYKAKNSTETLSIYMSRLVASKMR